MYKFKSYINGEFTCNKEWLNIVSPLNNEICGQVSALNQEDINNAFSFARKSFKNWSSSNIEERVLACKKISEKLLDEIDSIAKIINIETAKTMDDSISEVKRTSEYINQTIDTYQNIYHRTMKVNKVVNNLYRVPLGVVLAISPFNYPLNLAMSKIIPAILSGNTVVFKPATNGSLTGGKITEIIDSLKLLPKGVFNLVTGRGRDIGDQLTSNNQINMISFTGGVKVGHRIMENNPRIPLVLELGGNDAAYIRNDADIYLASKLVAKGAFSFSGQRCTAIKRLIVHNNIKNEFIDLLKKEVLKITEVPLINNGAADWVEKLLNDSNNKIILGGSRNENKFNHTIVETNKNSLAWKEEAFGPLLPIIYVSNDDEAVDIMNDTNFGLQNSIFTKDIEWARYAALRIESGTVNINKSSSRGPDEFPFLGIKDSGFGTQGIEEALLSMTRYLGVVNEE